MTDLTNKDGYPDASVSTAPAHMSHWDTAEVLTIMKQLYLRTEPSTRGTKIAKCLEDLGNTHSCIKEFPNVKIVINYLKKEKIMKKNPTQVLICVKAV